MAPRAPSRARPSSSLRSLPPFSSLAAALLALVGLGACLQDAVASSARADDAPIVSGVAPPNGQPAPASPEAPAPLAPEIPNEPGELSEKPSFSAPTARLAIVDAAGTLHVLDGSGAVLASAAGRATDVVAGGGSIATFEPATGDAPGTIRVFTLTGSSLVEGPPRPITTETGGLVAIGLGGDAVLAWEEAERASLLAVGPFDSGGVPVGSPASIRVARFPDGSPAIEALITASGAPRIDRFRIDPGGGLSPSDDFPVSVAPDVEARLASAADATTESRLLVSLEQGSVRLRDEAGGEEIGPVVPAKATLEDAAARAGRLALLLGAPPQLLLRDPDGVYTAHALGAGVSADPRPSHRLALTPDAVFFVSQAGLGRLAWPKTTKTATGPVEPVLGGGVAVVVIEPVD